MRARARSWGGKSRFEAAAITPGFAKRYQNGTEPSAKSTHCVPAVGMPQGSAARAGEGADREHGTRTSDEDEKTPHDATF